MRKLLPVLFFFLLFFGQFFFFSEKIFAVDSSSGISGESWVSDSDVTFAGKMASRANDFLNLTLKDYHWSSLLNNDTNPLIPFWITIRNIIYAFLLVIVLITAFMLIINRNKNITIMRFIPRFVFVILFITFSFSLIQFLYQITDIIQGFFLKNSQGKIISSADLLNISFNYAGFEGFRRIGSAFDESAFMSLLLVKLTTITYFIMTGVLLVRKIILWFFIAISPILPLLLLYPTIRNTAKIWIGEFFRWLLYAPLFAILLSQLVSLWHSRIPLPLGLPTGCDSADVLYPTAINILLGGPGQCVSITNNINNPDTFALYVVALLMLWVVIILPFILLQIFLDYFHTLVTSDPASIKQFITTSFPFLNKHGGSGVPQPPPPAPVLPVMPTSTGMARALPFNKPFKEGLARQIPIQQTASTTNAYQYRQPVQASNWRSTPANTEIIRMTNLSVPTMRDIARYETSSFSKDFNLHREVSHTHEVLERIANPSIIGAPVERNQFNLVKEKLTKEKQIGNPLATSVLSAANYVTEVSKANEAGKVSKTTASVPSSFPVVNRVQAVSLDDYEAIKKMWEENYQKLEAPKGKDGSVKTRDEWIKEDMDKINETINLLSSPDQQKVKQGIEMVGNILPFLLVGGFSQTEVIAYLKAKLEAGKNTLSEINKKEEEEDTVMSAVKKHEEKAKEMTAEAEVEPQEKMNHFIDSHITSDQIKAQGETLKDSEINSE